MSEIRSAESERTSGRGKWYIAASAMVFVAALVIRPMIDCPKESAAEVARPVSLPPIPTLPPTDTGKSEKAILDQLIESARSQGMESESSPAVESDPNRLPASKEAAQLRALDIEMADLDGYVTEERQRIEAWYASALAQLKAWAESRCKALDGDEAAAWEWCLQQIRNTRTRTGGAMMTESHSQASEYTSPSGYVGTSNYAQTSGRITQGKRGRAAGDPAGDYRKYLVGIRNSRDAVERELNRLREMRDRHLADLEAFANRKKAAIATQRISLSREAQRRTQGGPGLLDGIFASGSGYGAMIEGEIVQEGSVINGYQVRSITRDSVQCEKDGQVFTLSMP